MRVFSYGGGVQSTAALVLAVQGRIDFPTFLFANVGDDSEHPATLRYVREVAMPYAAANGIALEVVRHWEDQPEHHWRKTLYQRLIEAGPKGGQFAGIPVKMEKGLARRSCTQDYKIGALVEWCVRHGAAGQEPAVVGLGISLDEFHRARRGSEQVQQLVYPLLDLRLTRDDCKRVIADGGLPVPPKSSCWFCPYHSNAAWQDMREREPGLFGSVVDLERVMTERRRERGYGPVYFHNGRVPLDQATSPHRQLPLLPDEGDTCESGYCMT